jgi:hypothetical protein
MRCVRRQYAFGEDDEDAPVRCERFLYYQGDHADVPGTHRMWYARHASHPLYELSRSRSPLGLQSVRRAWSRSLRSRLGKLDGKTTMGTSSGTNRHWGRYRLDQAYSNRLGERHTDSGPADRPCRMGILAFFPLAMLNGIPGHHAGYRQGLSTCGCPTL